MPRTFSGKRYAQAAFELALEKSELEVWREDLRRAAAIISDAQLMVLLENPKLPFHAKKSLLEERLGKMNPLVFNLICLLMGRGRLKIIGNVADHYNRLLDAHNGIERADVITALPLDDEETNTLARRLGELVGHTVIVDARTDPSVIGGFRARIGDVLIDGSIHNKLELLRHNLIGAGR
ncbi:MAG: ATP synthase F1 subunit delta [Deltaproteobacteria bacterium]|nr:MAG: ATP synthase F1 subunit delta [Deltaproteobacteria bacterium]